MKKKHDCLILSIILVYKFNDYYVFAYQTMKLNQYYSKYILNHLFLLYLINLKNKQKCQKNQYLHIISLIPTPKIA